MEGENRPGAEFQTTANASMCRGWVLREANVSVYHSMQLSGHGAGLEEGDSEMMFGSQRCF